MVRPRGAPSGPAIPVLIDQATFDQRLRIDDLQRTPFFLHGPPTAKLAERPGGRFAVPGQQSDFFLWQRRNQGRGSFSFELFVPGRLWHRGVAMWRLPSEANRRFNPAAWWFRGGQGRANSA